MKIKRSGLKLKVVEIKPWCSAVSRVSCLVTLTVPRCALLAASGLTNYDLSKVGNTFDSNVYCHI